MTLSNSSFSSVDVAMMQEALSLAREGLYSTRPNPAVGCVIAKDHRVVGRGAHLRAGEPHAEVHALANAGTQARGATAYVTLEPCSHTGLTPPCSLALIRANVSRVVVACLDPNPKVQGEGLRQLQNAGIQTAYGLLANEARALNAGFMSRMERGRPYVRCKIAMSLDGRTALANGQSQWITGAAAREDGHLLRARAGAILTGSGTVVYDDPLLTVRHPLFDRSGLHQPLRVVVDSQQITPPDARLFSVTSPVLLAHAFTTHYESAIQSYPTSATCIAIPADSSNKVDLRQLLCLLASEYSINDVHVEAGAGLIGALLQYRLIDELVCYMAPDLLGDTGRGVAALPQIMQLDQKIKTQIKEIVPIGHDWRITAHLIHPQVE